MRSITIDLLSTIRLYKHNLLQTGFSLFPNPVLTQMAGLAAALLDALSTTAAVAELSAEDYLYERVFTGVATATGGGAAYGAAHLAPTINPRKRPASEQLSIPNKAVKVSKPYSEPFRYHYSAYLFRSKRPRRLRVEYSLIASRARTAKRLYNR